MLGMSRYQVRIGNYRRAYGEEMHTQDRTMRSSQCSHQSWTLIAFVAVHINREQGKESRHAQD